MMKNKTSLTLGEVRDAYGEILGAYNELFPVHPASRTEGEDITGKFGKGEESLIDAASAKMREMGPKLKEAADQSGNAVIWRRGDSLEGLNQSLKCRIEAAIKFGI